MLGWGLMPVGALAGGFVAHAAGLRAPYIVACLVGGFVAHAAIPLLLAARQKQPRLGGRVGEDAGPADGLPALPGADQRGDHRLDGDQVHQLPVDDLLQREQP